jgi:hypothetical protein
MRATWSAVSVTGAATNSLALAKIRACACSRLMYWAAMHWTEAAPKIAAGANQRT